MLKVLHLLENISRLRNWYIQKAIKNNLRKISPSFNYLDIGCGSGVFSIPYAIKFKEARFTCLDKVSNNISMIELFSKNQKIRNIETINDDVCNFEGNRKYDFIILASVLHNIPNDVEVLESINNLLSDDGKFLLYLPIDNNRIFKWFTVLSNGFLKTVNYNLTNKVYHYYSKKSLIELLEKTGYQINSIKITYGFWGKLYYEIFTILEMFLKKGPIVISLVVLLIMILLSPFLLLFMLLDFILKNNEGNGILIQAKK